LEIQARNIPKVGFDAKLHLKSDVAGEIDIICLLLSKHKARQENERLDPRQRLL
jgi:hypothetical protein